MAADQPVTTAGDRSFFSGPTSNKVAATTVAAAAATLFWTIAARTFWRTISADDLALFTTTTTIILTGSAGFLVPESAAFAAHTSARLGASPVPQSTDTDARLRSLESTLQALQVSITPTASRTHTPTVSHRVTPDPSNDDPPPIL